MSFNTCFKQKKDKVFPPKQEGYIYMFMTLIITKLRHFHQFLLYCVFS